MQLRTMFCRICMVLVVLCFASVSTVQLEYFQTINDDTGLRVGAFCGDDNGFLDDSDDDDDLLNFCELLDNAFLEPESSEVQYNMASHFGMNGSSCPIHPGIKKLTEPPINFTMRGVGCDVMYYKIKIMAGNKILGENATTERRMDLDQMRKNGTFIENSSSIFTMPSVTVSIGICLFVISLNY